MTTVSITTDLVFANGKIDQEASVEAFETELSRKTVELETEEVEIAAAVATLFDTHHGKSIDMPTVGSMTATALNAQPENHAVLSKRVLDYVRKNSQGKVKDDIEENPTSLFIISKGKGGGCCRRSDKAVKVAEATE